MNDAKVRVKILRPGGFFHEIRVRLRNKDFIVVLTPHYFYTMITVKHRI